MAIETEEGRIPQAFRDRVAQLKTAQDVSVNEARALFQIAAKFYPDYWKSNGRLRGKSRMHRIWRDAYIIAVLQHTEGMKGVHKLYLAEALCISKKIVYNAWEKRPSS